MKASSGVRIQHLQHEPIHRVICGLVTVAVLPFGLASCAQVLPAAAGQAAADTQLRAAPNTNMLSNAAPREYEVTGIEISSPASFRQLAAVGITSSGSLTLGDRVITGASIQASLATGQDISFTLTEPLVLRRNIGADAPLYAVGTIAVPGSEWHGARVRVTPDFSDEQQAILDLQIPLPDSLVTPGGGEAAATVIEARVTLAAE